MNWVHRQVCRSSQTRSPLTSQTPSLLVLACVLLGKFHTHALDGQF
jgi:hypothetical protein